MGEGEPETDGKPEMDGYGEGEKDGYGEGEKDGYGKGEKGGKSYIDDTDDDPKYLQPNPTKECSACAMKCMMGDMEKDGKGKGEGKDDYNMSGECSAEAADASGEMETSGDEDMGSGEGKP